LFHQQAHWKVDTKRTDLIGPKVINDGVRDPDCPACRGNSGKLTGMRAGEVRLNGGLALINKQVLELHPRIKRALMHIPDQLAGRLAPDGPLVGPFERGNQSSVK
jgi:hypothetical protein